jgi:hypothetical protein
LPPATASVPFHKKARLILSISLDTHGGGSRDNKWKMAIALRTDWTRISHPPCVSICVSHNASLLLIFSIRVKKSTFLVFLIWRGKLNKWSEASPSGSWGCCWCLEECLQDQDYLWLH